MSDLKKCLFVVYSSALLSPVVLGIEPRSLHGLLSTVPLSWYPYLYFLAYFETSCLRLSVTSLYSTGRSCFCLHSHNTEISCVNHLSLVNPFFPVDSYIALLMVLTLVLTFLFVNYVLCNLTYEFESYFLLFVTCLSLAALQPPCYLSVRLWWQCHCV